MRRAMELWRRLPSPLREGAHRSVQALSRSAIPLWLRLAWRPGHAPRPDAPVTVVGLLRSSIGIGQGARLFARALEHGGLAVRRMDAGPGVQSTPDLDPIAPFETALAAGDAAARGGVVVTHLNPPELERLLEVSHAGFLRGARHVGYWAWELPAAPRRWRRAFGYVDEVWAPSRFTADALRRLALPSTPVHVVPHPVWASERSAADRAGLGLPADACLVLVALDLRSTAARKNPRGALEAYRRAVPVGAPERCALVCKLTGARAEPVLFAALKAECADRLDILLIDRVLSGDGMRALVASVDIVFSPHRAEGFGLLLAEGMRAGKAVVATGWSGNMDFMDETCAALIPWTLTPAIDPQGMYAGAEWAEPDLDAAASHLERLVADPSGRRALGARAAAQAGPVFDPQAWRALVSDRLWRRSASPAPGAAPSRAAAP